MHLNQNIPSVSIVICTFNRKDLLKDCLNSIFAMEYPRRYYEVIIVDGGSTDGTDELCKKFSNIHFVVERKKGLASARNIGAELACNPIVAYTDDDCIVDKQWLKYLTIGFKFYKNIAGVGGPVFPLKPEIIPKKIYVKAALGLYDEGEKIKLTQAIITSNAAFKKEVFKNVQFNEKLGVTRRGKLVLSGEDTAFSHTLRKSGYKLLYMPYAKVYHQIQRDRIRVPYIIKHALHGGIIKTKIFLNAKQSRVWATRYALGQLVQCLFKTPLDTSFTSCYNLVYCISTLFNSVTGLNRIF